jgi:hypothetical protein
MPLRSTGDAQLDGIIARQLRYGQTRWMEVLLAGLMAAVGVALLWPGETFKLPSFHVIANLLSEDVAGWGACIIGAARLQALYINGRRRNTPVVRVFGCLVGAVFWIGWFLGFSATNTPMVPLFPMSLVMALGEIIAGSRATRDLYAYNSLGLRKGRPPRDVGRTPI